MDRHGDADSNIERVDDGQITQPFLLRKKAKHCKGHGEGDGSMRRRPTPENSAAQNAEFESAAHILTNHAQGMSAARYGLITCGNHCANELSLPNGPADH